MQLFSKQKDVELEMCGKGYRKGLRCCGYRAVE